MANCVWKSFAMALLLVSLVSVVNCSLPDLFLNQTRVQECKKNFEQVRDIDSLETVLTLTLLSYNRNYLSKRVFAKCLGIEKDAVDKVLTFQTFINSYKNSESSLCKKKSKKNIIYIYAEMIEDGGELTRWWDKFVFEVMVRCKVYLVDLLKDETHLNIVLKSIKNIYDLAQNFNWQDVKHFIKEGDAQHTNVDEKSLQDVSYLAKSSGNLDDIQRVRVFELNYRNRKRQPAQTEVQVTEEQFHRFKDLLRSCVRIDYNYERIEPVIDLMRLNYHLSAGPVDEYLASSMYINLWIVAVQMCDAFRLVKIQYLRNEKGMVKLTFKTVLNSRAENMIESTANSLEYPWRENYMLYDILPLYTDLPEYDSDFIPVPVSDDEMTSRKNSINESSKILGETILSQPFLDKLASYLKSM